MIFALIYFSTIQEWFNDFSEDSEKTMSILDKRLGMFEDFFIQVN